MIYYLLKKIFVLYQIYTIISDRRALRRYILNFTNKKIKKQNYLKKYC